MTTFSTPCTVLTVTSTGAIEIEHLDCLEDARQYISDFFGEEEAQAAPYNGEDDDYLVRPWLVDGWASRAEWLYAG